MRAHEAGQDIVIRLATARRQKAMVQDAINAGGNNPMMFGAPDKDLPNTPISCAGDKTKTNDELRARLVDQIVPELHCLASGP
jgi:1,2-phenylacetyl-CoA epoxidase catalytic subunit